MTIRIALALVRAAHVRRATHPVAEVIARTTIGRLISLVRDIAKAQLLIRIVANKKIYLARGSTRRSFVSDLCTDLFRLNLHRLKNG